MKELKGTEKQIKWANDIKNKSLERPLNFLNNKAIYLIFKNTEEKRELGLQVIKEVQEYVDYINSLEDAAFIIENRFVFNIENRDDYDSVEFNEEYRKKNNITLISKRARRAIVFLERRFEIGGSGREHFEKYVVEYSKVCGENQISEEKHNYLLHQLKLKNTDSNYVFADSNINGSLVVNKINGYCRDKTIYGKFVCLYNDWNCNLHTYKIRIYDSSEVKEVKEMVIKYCYKNKIPLDTINL